MKRLVTLVVCMLALGTACSRPSSAPAATVNGTKISTQDLLDELNAIGGNTEYLNALQSNAAARGISVTGSTPGSYDAAYVSQLLLTQILHSLVHAEFLKRNVPVDDACRLRARNEVRSQLGGRDAEAGDRALAKFPQPYQDLLERRNTELLALELALVDAQCGHEAESYFTSHSEDFVTVCASLILVADQATADDVAARARAGEDFAALAQQMSTDPSGANGGDAGCRFTGNLDPDLASTIRASKRGDVLNPVPSQGGFTIIKINDLRPAELSNEARSQADELASLAADRAFRTWLQEAKAEAHVTIDPRYGTFDASTFQINPPTLDLNSGSSGPSGSSSSDTP